MSRIGKSPVKLASGVKVAFKAPEIEVSGKLGTLRKTLPATIEVKVEGEKVLVINNSDDLKLNNLYGLSRTLIQNMVRGVSEGFTKNLELKGVGYRAQAQGNTLNLQLGFSHPVEYPLPTGIQAKVDANTKITLTGADKELLGQVAANIRKIRPPEPYKGKGIRYEGEHISLKQGKAAGK